MKELHPQPFHIQGTPAFTFDALPPPGSEAPDFNLTDRAFKDWTLGDFSGQWKILNIVPSLDTPVCQLSAKRFLEECARRKDVAVLTISADLPFAQARFCDGLNNAGARFFSTFRSPEFGMDYGTLIVDHPMMGLQARAVVVMDANNIIRHTQLVAEMTHEPDYAAALAVLPPV